VGSYLRREGESGAKRRRRVLVRGDDPGRTSRKKAAADQVGKKRKSRRTRSESPDSSDKRTSAFLNSELLCKRRERFAKAPRERIVVADRDNVEKDSYAALNSNAESPKGQDNVEKDSSAALNSNAGNPRGQSIAELPTKLARIRRADVEAEKEDAS
jgi:hypothetical protein